MALTGCEILKKIDFMNEEFLNCLSKYFEKGSCRAISTEDADNVVTNFRNRMLRNISNRVKEKYSLDTYPWHLYSFNIIPNFEGSQAISHYHRLFIKRFYVIIYKEKKIILCEKNISIPYYDLIKIKSETGIREDIYIIHPNFKWLFVIPHENDIGPYLYVEK